jgi:NAD(P)-dependent dehydrogenase (short-subunit alcohol dehydrogenase family)
MTTELRGRNIVICGAASGIGAAAVQGLSDRGATVAAVYHHTAPPASLERAARWYQCDVSQKADVDALFERIAVDLGHIDALIQPAGTWRGALPEAADEEHIDFLLSVNLKSTIYTNQAAFRHMRERGGRIVNFGSVEGIEGRPESPVYAASKAAVQAWTRSVARAWGRHNITVNAIAPVMHTALFGLARAQLTPDQLEAMDRDIAARIPIGGKFGEPLRDCVPMLAFLVGEGAQFITGQLFCVDGGLHMMSA